MVDKKTVEYVAKLARINLAPEQINPFAEQLSKIFGYIDQLKKLDTTKVEPLISLHGKRIEALRKDEVKCSECRERILKNSPLLEGDYFKIPKVIE